MRNVLFAMVFICATLAHAQSWEKRELTRLKYSDPAAQGLIRVDLLEGSIEIEGHDSEEIIVFGNRPLEETDNRSGSGRDGLRLVRARSSGIEIKEMKNEMRINTNHFSDDVHLLIQVPRKTSLNLQLVNGGYIKVSGVSGEHNIEVVNGGLEMANISGSVLAHVLNEDMKISFDQVTPDKPMSFTSLNGTIDVTLPASIKATLHCDTKNGEIYTGFDTSFKTKTARRTHDSLHGSHISIKDEVVAELNGGAEKPYIFKTMNGDILIRKGK